MSKIKISQLPTSTQTDGLYTIGVNANNSSVKVPIGELIDDKVDKVSGKQLSTNDYTNEEKQKLADIQDDMLMITYGVTPFTTIQQAILNYKYLACYETTERKAYHIVSYSATAVQMQCVVGNVNYGIAVTSTNQWSKASLTLPKVEYVDTSVAAEATARANADNALTTSISNEATARQSADNNLSTSISKRIAKPDASVPQGYVPASDGQGDVTWQAQSGGGGVPTPTVEDAGKVVAVSEAGEYELSDKMATKREMWLNDDLILRTCSSANMGVLIWEDADGKQHQRVLATNEGLNSDEQANAVKILHYPCNAKTTTLQQKLRQVVNCTSLVCNDWDTSNVTLFRQIFQANVKITELDVSGWDVSKSTTFLGTFYGMSSLQRVNIEAWGEVTPGAASMYAIFFQCYALESVDMSLWDMNGATFSDAFYQCTNLRYVKLGTNTLMFSGTLALDQQKFGLQDDLTTSNGWLEEVASIAPTLEEGDVKTIKLHTNLKNKSWASQYLTILTNKGFTIA